MDQKSERFFPDWTDGILNGLATVGLVANSQFTECTGCTTSWVGDWEVLSRV